MLTMFGMVSEPSSGEMEENMSEIGTMGNSMAKESTQA